MNTRPAALAGQWYPGSPEKLRSSIEKYLKAASAPAVKGHISAIVVPHAGHSWSGPTAAAAYKRLPADTYSRVIIMCPNHRIPLHGAVSVSADAFETPLGSVEVDRETVGRYIDAGIIGIDDAAHRLEHAIEIQLPFLQVVFAGSMPKIVPIIVGDLRSSEAAEMGRVLRKDLKDDTLIIISTDLLHYGEAYGYVPFGAPVQPQIELYDSRTIEAISRFDAEAFEEFADANPHAACGINALRVLACTFDKLAAKAVKLAYDTSGRRSGDDDMSVSYTAIAVTLDADADSEESTMNENKTNAPMSADAQKTAHALVRRALEAAVEAGHTTPMPRDIDFGSVAAEFKESYGVFVTLNDASGMLRGCIGNILPQAPLAESLWGRAQDAALNDPRFDPVTSEELRHLKVEISVLTRPETIGGPDEIVVGRHGVVLKKGFRSAVFLPQVAPEQGWGLETMLNHLSLKAGLAPNAWQEGASFQTFEAQVF